MKKLILEKKNKDDFDTVATTIRLSRTLVKRLDDVAHKTGYTRNEIAVRFLEFALENVVLVDSDKDNS